MKKFVFLLVLAFSFSLTALAQQTNLDSLHQIWLDKSQPDTVRFEAYTDFIWKGYLYTNPDTVNTLAQQLQTQAQEKENKKWQAEALKIQGISFYFRSGHAKALDYLSRSLKMQEEMGNKKGIASSLNNIGLIYEDQGDGAKALEYYIRSLKILEEIGYKKGIAASLTNIGVIYFNQANYTKALDYYIRSSKIQEEIGNKVGVANSLGNVGTIYSKQDDHDRALDYYTRGLKIQKEIGNKIGIAIFLRNIGAGYKEQGDLKQAESYAKQSLIIGQEIGSPELISGAAEVLYEVYKKQQNFKALAMHELYIQMRDSIKSEEITKQIAQAESRAEFEKEMLIKEQEEQEAARIEAEKIDQRNTIQYSGIGIGIFALFGFVFL